MTSVFISIMLDEIVVNASITVKVLGRISIRIMAENWKDLGPVVQN